MYHELRNTKRACRGKRTCISYLCTHKFQIIYYKMFQTQSSDTKSLLMTTPSPIEKAFSILLYLVYLQYYSGSMHTNYHIWFYTNIVEIRNFSYILLLRNISGRSEIYISTLKYVLPLRNIVSPLRNYVCPLRNMYYEIWIY